METKFTKGNWFIKESKFENTDILCQTVLMTDAKFEDKMRSPIICDLWGQATEEGKATAKLLCAAPDLLEALEILLKSTYPNYTKVDDSAHPANLALKAIKKAMS